MERKSSKASDYSHFIGTSHVLFRGAFLTPKEMDDLTEHWKPYRSIGMMCITDVLFFDK